MKYNFNSAVLIAALASTVDAASLINGNWYGNLTDRITYTGWGTPGVYQKVTDMSAGNCVKEPVAYAGGMAPLDGEVSFHLRGPMHLKQFAFYAQASSNSKRTTRPTRHQKRHNHGHLHRKRDVGDWVTITMNGQAVSWINQYTGPPATSTSTSTTIPTSPALTSNNAAISSSTSTSSPSDTAPSSSLIPPPSSPTSNHLSLPFNDPEPNTDAISWSRQSYYSASLTNSTADGLTFLNNQGGITGSSGTWDYNFGASLSYASSDGLTSSASPQVLNDTLLPDDTEIILYTDKPCLSSDTQPCDPSRPGAVAYHGFSGASKLFLMEFSMPMSYVTGSQNADMPSIWILNAAIPRTEQYGSCNCWPECGEWDIFEVLDPGNTRAKSTIHAGVSGGDSDYFERPVDKTIKAAVIFYGSNSTGHIVVLPDDTVFGTSVSDGMIAEWGREQGANGYNGTVFNLGSS